MGINESNPKVNRTTICSSGQCGSSSKKQNKSKKPSDEKISSKMNINSKAHSRKTQADLSDNCKSNFRRHDKSLEIEDFTQKSDGKLSKVNVASGKNLESSVSLKNLSNSNEKRCPKINANMNSKSGKTKRNESTPHARESASENISNKKPSRTVTSISGVVRPTSWGVPKEQESKKNPTGYPSPPPSISPSSKENKEMVLELKTEEEADSKSESNTQVVEKSPDGSVVRIITYLGNGKKRIVTKLRLLKNERLEDFDISKLDEFEREKFMEAIQGVPTKELSYPKVDEFLKSIRKQSTTKIIDTSANSSSKRGDTKTSTKSQKTKSSASSKCNQHVEKNQSFQEKI